MIVRDLFSVEAGTSFLLLFLITTSDNIKAVLACVYVKVMFWCVLLAFSCNLANVSVECVQVR